ncbi:MAG: SCO family protein [Flavobacteriaceae bacterium]|nr:SCO family protein [Flavobacteriaceae bacterium]
MEIAFFKKSVPSIIRIGLLFIIFVSIGYFLLTPEKKLPVYNPADVNPKLVDATVKHKRSNHKISDFTLINQNGDIITQNNYDDKIYIADFFFTRCQTICPIMTINMFELQSHYKNDPDIMFLSHSVTPFIDSVAVLRKYADEKGVIDDKWNLVTGDKMHIYNLARKSYFAVLDEGDGGAQDFIHTEQFILVDKKKQIRGFYDGTDKEEMNRIFEDIEILKKEYDK